jgi:hypothetical protein
MPRGAHNTEGALLVCESVFIGLFDTRPGEALSNCPLFTHYKGGNLQWPLHDGGWVKEERHAVGFPAATEDQIEARRAKER